MNSSLAANAWARSLTFLIGYARAMMMDGCFELVDTLLSESAAVYANDERNRRGLPWLGFAPTLLLPAP
eukprot:scaffold12540_cov78-Skeletonema_marinoi.AAC.1